MGIKAKADKITGYIRDYGISYAAKKVYYRYKIKYKLGKKYCPFEISDAQRKSEQEYKPAQKIKVSIVVPLYNTPENFLREMLSSVEAQTYADWELCLADASDEENGQVGKTVEQYQAKDKRIKYKKLSENEGISENTNRALEMAAGDYIGLMDHDDLLHPSVLYNVVKTIEEKKADFIYTDELSFVGTTDRVQSIHFKPDFSWETFRNNNFICHFTAFKRSLLEKTGGFRKEFDGAQDYDMFFRLLEKAERVCHIQKVLYYWRIHSASTASGMSAKPYIVEAGKKAIESNLERMNLKGTVEASKEHGSFYRVRYEESKLTKVKILVSDKKRESEFRKKTARFMSELQLKNKENDIYEISIEKISDRVKMEDLNKILNESDVVMLVRSGYDEIGSVMAEYQDSDENIIDELLSCIVPSENMVASNTVLDIKKRYVNSGWGLKSKKQKQYVPLYKGVSSKDAGYMNRLHFKQSVSLLDGSVLAIKTEIIKKWLEKKFQDVKKQDKEPENIDLFCRGNWFEMCMEVNKEKGNCVLTPYFPAVISKVREGETDNAQFVFESEMAEKDRYYNEGMEKFGREYFLW